jgi:hypothetical protein
MKLEIIGYVGLILTVIGQILVGYFYLAGLACWLVANILYLLKACGQNLGKAEVMRNVIMLGITGGLMLLWIF